MVAATRLAEKNALLHIRNDILNLEDDSKLHRACEYEIVNSPLGLILFTPLEVEDVEYKRYGRNQTQQGTQGTHLCIASHGIPWEIGW
jgi:hypothetical protein